jgi:hypothetical protein
VKKEVLKFSENDLSSNVILYAISSSQSDIHLCQLINKSFGIALALSEPLEITKKNSTLHFTRYEFISDEEIDKFHLIINRSSGHYLFPELKKIDYFLIISSESPIEPIDSAIQELKSYTGISAVYKLEPAALKSFGKLQI